MFSQIDKCVYQDGSPKISDFFCILFPEAFNHFSRRIGWAFKVFAHPPTVLAHIVEIGPWT